MGSAAGVSEVSAGPLSEGDGSSTSSAPLEKEGPLEGTRWAGSGSTAESDSGSESNPTGADSLAGDSSPTSGSKEETSAVSDGAVSSYGSVG